MLDEIVKIFSRLLLTTMDIFSLKTLAYLIAFINIVDASNILRAEKLSKIALRRLVAYIFIALFWIIFGLFNNYDAKLIGMEGIACSYTMMALLLKLNLNKVNELFGKPIPGHGTPETKAMIKTKYYILYIIIFAIILLVAWSFGAF